MPDANSREAARDAEHPYRLLLVEDDAGDAFLVQERLAGGSGQADFDVLWVRSIREARQAGGPSVDSALVDLGLPDASGLDALAAVVAAYPDAAVVVLTGLSDRRLALEAVAAGAQDYLIKDEVTTELFDRTIRLAIGRRQAEHAAVALAEATVHRQHNDRVSRGLLPRLRVHDESLRLATRYAPGRAGELLGGDFLDAVELEDGTVRVILGDVAGHGPDEAAVGVNLRIAWRALTLAGSDPETTIRRLQDMVIRDVGIDGLFVTATDLTVSSDRRSLAARYAGHPAPLLVHAGEVRDLDGPRGMMLGIELDAVPPEVSFALPETWRLLLFSDGLVEGHAGPGRDRRERWGTDGLAVHVAEHWHAPPERLADELIAEATRRNGGPLPDDTALLIMARDGTD